MAVFKSRRQGFEPRYHSDRIELAGEAEWIFEGEEPSLAAVAEALGSLAEWIGGVLLVRFGNAVGSFDLPHLGRVEVVSGKWTRSDFDALLADLTAEAAALPFHGGRPAALPYDRTLAAREDLLYASFVYLRSILSDTVPPDERLLPALAAILADPHRRLRDERVAERLEHARRVDARTVERLVSSPGRLSRATMETPIARALRGHLPERVDERRTTATLDTPENRFVRTFLLTVDAILRNLESSFRREADPFALRIAGECRALRGRLAPVLRHRMWTEVGPMIHLPAASTVLHYRRGYRQVFQSFARLRLAARVPLAPEVLRRLLEIRDAAELYEIWCFFEMVRAVREILGPPASADAFERRATHLALPRFQVLWPDGTTLDYNRIFQPDGGASYSVPLRPDITLSVPGRGLHLFDAKFRLDRLPVEEDDVRGDFKRADLYKMHTYRDAIPEARSVWALYPGTETRFFGRTSGIWSGEGDLPAPLDGVGGLPLLPRSGREPLRAVLSALLDGSAR